MHGVMHGAFWRAATRRVAQMCCPTLVQSRKTHEKESNAAFQGVFTAKTTAELEAAYDTWAATYDKTVEMILNGDGENHPTTELVKTIAAAGIQGPIQHVLDCGAGTGAAGPLLRSQFTDGACTLKSLVAFDLSAGMLAQARARDCYTAFVQGRCPSLAGAVEATSPPGKLYDLVFCAGTFTPNHAPPSTLPELVKICRPGGYVCFTVRSYFFEDDSSGFKAAQKALVDSGAWTLVADQERTYLVNEGVMARNFVYQTAREP